MPIRLTSVACIVALAVSGRAVADEWADVNLTSATPRLTATWNVGAMLQATANVTVSAVGSLSQQHGGRLAVYRQDGTFVEGREVLAGNSGSLTFRLTPGSYFMVFDLGVEDPEEPVGSIRMQVQGDVLDLTTEEPVPIRPNEETPPEPPTAPPSNLGAPGDQNLPPGAFPPLYEVKGLGSQLMHYLVDLTS